MPPAALRPDAPNAKPDGGLRSSLRGASELLYPPEEMLKRSIDANQPAAAPGRAGGRRLAEHLPAVLEGDELARSLRNGTLGSTGAGQRSRPLSGVQTLSVEAAPAEEEEHLSRAHAGIKPMMHGVPAGRLPGPGPRPRSASQQPGGALGSPARSPSYRPPGSPVRPASSPAARTPGSRGTVSAFGSYGGSRPVTPGLDTLVRKAEERLRQLQLTETTPEAQRIPSPLLANGGRVASSLAAQLGAAAGSVSDTGTLRASLQGESEYVPIGAEGTQGMAAPLGTAGSLPDWFQHAAPGREALASRGSVASDGAGGGGGTTGGLARRTAMQLQRIKEYEQKLGAGGSGTGVYGSAGGAAGRAPPSPGGTPTRPEGSTDADVVQRMAWLNSLEESMGEDGQRPLASDHYHLASGSEGVRRRSRGMATPGSPARSSARSAGTFLRRFSGAARLDGRRALLLAGCSPEPSLNLP